MRIVLDGVTKRFKKVEALRKVDLEILDGELFTLLGPSGCGKTTTLRLIAGFYKPDTGHVYFDDRVVDDLHPSRRNIGIVFQNFALWPHMSVYKNIAYGLQIQKLPKAEIDSRVQGSLEKVGLSGMGERFPGQLSGGQQQRVALARALVLNPSVLLLDEPLSALDAKVRVRLRAEIRKIQQELGITTVYVTHDQEEALMISDRIAVMKDGVLQQIGTPRELYERPANPFVADFIGINNLITGEVEKTMGTSGEEGEVGYVLKSGLGSIYGISAHQIALGTKCCMAVRPENMTIVQGSDPISSHLMPASDEGEANVVAGVVEFCAYMGNTLRYEIGSENGIVLKADVKDPWHHDPISIGENVRVIFPSTATIVIPEGR